MVLDEEVVPVTIGFGWVPDFDYGSRRFVSPLAHAGGIAACVVVVGKDSEKLDSVDDREVTDAAGGHVGRPSLDIVMSLSGKAAGRRD